MKKVVVITGANKGIGLALANTFKQQGDEVYGVCRNSSTELDKLSVNVISGVDVTNREDLTQLQAALSGINIDVLVCNAGILRDESLDNLNIETIKAQFDVNAIAPLLVCQLLKTHLVDGGKIAMITSRMGSIADNTSGGRYGYRMSKAALNIASVSLAHDLSDREIAVGIYHPGHVNTEMVNYNGDISSQVCAERLVGLINQLSMAKTGVFRHSNGDVLPW